MSTRRAIFAGVFAALVMGGWFLFRLLAPRMSIAPSPELYITLLVAIGCVVAIGRSV